MNPSQNNAAERTPTAVQAIPQPDSLAPAGQQPPSPTAAGTAPDLAVVAVLGYN